MSPPSDHFNENWQLSGSSILTPKRETNVGALELPDARLFTLLRRLLQAIKNEKKSGYPLLASPPRRAGWGMVGANVLDYATRSSFSVSRATAEQRRVSRSPICGSLGMFSMP